MMGINDCNAFERCEYCTMGVVDEKKGEYEFNCRRHDREFVTGPCRGLPCPFAKATEENRKIRIYPLARLRHIVV